MSLALLLIAILALFLLRVPMAFAILGPCLAYLVAEGYSLGLAARLVVEGINSWPLLAVPLFILVGIVATCSVMLYGTYDFMTHDRGQVTAAAQVPLAVIYSVVAFGFASTALRGVLTIFVRDLPEIRTGEKAAA